MCDNVLDPAVCSSYPNLLSPKKEHYVDNSHGDGGTSDSGGSEFASMWKSFIKFVSGNFSLIREAYADPEGADPAGVELCRTPGATPTDCSYSHFRMPRGHVMPGKREITTVLNAVPPITPPPGEVTPPPSATPPLECPCCESGIKVIIQKCSGGSSDAAIEKRDKWNKALREAIASGGGDIGENDIFCESTYGVMNTHISIPGGAAPEAASADILSESINPSFTGNIGSAAIIHYRGEKPKDFSTMVELPLDTDMVQVPTIVLPTTADISSKFAKTAVGKAVTLTPQLSSAIAGIASTFPNIASAVPITPDLVTSMEMLSDNTLKLNNVIRWKVTAASMTKASGFSGAANHIIDWAIYPTMCSWSARCPDSKAFADENMYAKVDPKTILEKAKEYGSMCQNGLCPAEFFEKLGVPLYQNYGFALAQTIVAKSGETPTVDITEPNFMGGPPMESPRGGCGCIVTALPPDAASFVALLLIASMLIGSFVAVRVRARKK